jgi:hypothetical protein
MTALTNKAIPQPINNAARTSGCCSVLRRMAHPTRFERVTFAFGGQRSIQLSYGCVRVHLADWPDLGNGQTRADLGRQRGQKAKGHALAMSGPPKKHDPPLQKSRRGRGLRRHAVMRGLLEGAAHFEQIGFVMGQHHHLDAYRDFRYRKVGRQIDGNQVWLRSTHGSESRAPASSGRGEALRGSTQRASVRFIVKGALTC